MNWTKIKQGAIYGLIGIGICAGCFVCGYLVRQFTSSPLVVETQGEIIERTNIIYRPIAMGGDGGCDNIIRRYNGLLNDYQSFLNAAPEVYDVSPEKIFFRLYTQKYALSYHAAEKPKWSVAPIVVGRVEFPKSVSLYYGGGAIVDYGGVGGGIIIDNAPSVTIFAMWRCITWK